MLAQSTTVAFIESFFNFFQACTAISTISPVAKITASFPLESCLILPMPNGGTPDKFEAYEFAR